LPEVIDDPLRAMPLLAALTHEARVHLARRCAWRRVAPGETIIGRDDTSRAMVWIVEGRARVVDYTSSGREVVYAEFGPGDHVGELAALDGGPRSADVIAIAPCLVASLPSDDLHALVAREPTVAVGLLKDLTRIVRLGDLRITELSTMGAVHRICRELLRRGAPDGDGKVGVIEPLPTQEALAGLTGTTRETVARVLAQLAHAGLVRRQGRTMHLLDIQRLQKLGGLGDEIDTQPLL
jgi:CRP/FNR family transcriptional regulator, cyclic AMP receptor protein